MNAPALRGRMNYADFLGRSTFSRVVRPGETVRIEAERLFFRRGKLRSRVRLLCENGEVAAEGSVSGVGRERTGVLRHDSAP